MRHTISDTKHPTPEPSVDPVTGDRVVDFHSNPISPGDRFLTVFALLFTGLALWGIYSHRVDLRLDPHPDRPGIAYNLSAASAPPSPQPPQQKLSQLKERLHTLEATATEMQQLPGHRVLERRLLRLQILLEEHQNNPEEVAYVQRRLSEFDIDLKAFEQDLRQI